MEGNVIGTCSLCGGPVVVPMYWHGINRPPATCAKCGATKRADYGPIIDMEPPRQDRRCVVDHDRFDYRVIDPDSWGKGTAESEIRRLRDYVHSEDGDDTGFIDMRNLPERKPRRIDSRYNQPRPRRRR